MDDYVELPIEEDPVAIVDTAIDDILEAFKRIDVALPSLSAASIPQTAAIDAAKDAYEHGVKPYFADFIQGLDFLEEKQ